MAIQATKLDITIKQMVSGNGDMVVKKIDILGAHMPGGGTWAFSD